MRRQSDFDFVFVILILPKIEDDDLRQLRVRNWSRNNAHITIKIITKLEKLFAEDSMDTGKGEMNSHLC